METIEVVTEAVPASPADAKELVLKMLDEGEQKERVCAESLCALIKAVGMAGKDLHYRAKGDAFYSEHLLADLGWQVEKLTDDFIEVYYLGDKGWLPPTMDRIYAMAGGEVFTPMGDPDKADDTSTAFWAKRLLTVCEKLVEKVEEAKGVLTSKAGTQAALDEISKQALQVAGLLKRNLK